MGQSEIDRQFDDLLERVDSKSSLPGNPYSSLPLASDHFLLKKSWEYFRQRVKSIEEQWSQIVQSKETEILALKQALAGMQPELQGLQEEIKQLRAIDENLKKVRVKDFVDFKKQGETIHDAWEDERQSLVRQMEDLESKVGFANDRLEKQGCDFEIKMKAMNDLVMSLNKQIHEFAEKELKIRQSHAEAILAKDDHIRGLDAKIDLFRLEIEHRDQLLSQLRGDLEQGRRVASGQIDSLSRLESTVAQREREIENLKARIEVLEQDRDNIRRNWEAEQAQWRELWDRGRQTWIGERTRKANDSVPPGR